MRPDPDGGASVTPEPLPRAECRRSRAFQGLAGATEGAAARLCHVFPAGRKSRPGSTSTFRRVDIGRVASLKALPSKRALIHQCKQHAFTPLKLVVPAARLFRRFFDERVSGFAPLLILWSVLTLRAREVCNPFLERSSTTAVPRVQELTDHFGHRWHLWGSVVWHLIGTYWEWAFAPWPHRARTSRTRP